MNNTEDKQLKSNGKMVESHIKLTAEQMELHEVIDQACMEARLNTGNAVPTYTKVWIRKSMEEYLEKNAHKWIKSEVEPVATDNMATDKDKAEFLVEKIQWELRKMRMLSKGKPLSKDWADMERKARVLLNRFGQELPGAVQTALLIDMMALFMDMMFKTGKWDK